MLYIDITGEKTSKKISSLRKARARARIHDDPQRLLPNREGRLRAGFHGRPAAAAGRCLHRRAGEADEGEQDHELGDVFHGAVLQDD